jgi:hypothetical protein
VEAQMKFSVNLTDSASDIRSKILESIKEHLDKAFNAAVPRISIKLQGAVSDALKAEPEYTALTSGQLRYEFGIPDPIQVDMVIDAIVDTLHVTKMPIQATNFGLSGGIELSMMPSQDMGGVVNNDAALVIDESRGHKLPWLSWLLYEGNTPIVRQYRVQIGPNRASRTGMAIMKEANTNWRVPPEYAGTVSNNWTTRAIDRIENNISGILQNEIEKYL